MKLDSFVQLIQQLRTNSIADDTDPNNIVISKYTAPYDQISVSDSVLVQKSSITSFVWGDGSTYTVYDTSGTPHQAASCGWTWDTGGRYDGNAYAPNFVFPWQAI